MGPGQRARRGSRGALYRALRTRFRARRFSADARGFAAAARAAQAAGLGVNAGHDLNLKNLAAFCRIAGILEVSIGHALMADAFEMGLSNAVASYLRVLAANS